MISVEPLAAALEAAYDDLLDRHDDALIYHSLQYRGLLVELLGCTAEYLVASDSGELRGALPLMWARDPLDGGRVLNSLPYYGSNGGVVADTREVAEALLDAYDERAGDATTLAATLVENPFGELPRDPLHVVRDERISQVTALPEPGAGRGQWSDSVDSSARRNVRRARSAGYVVERDASAAATLHRIHVENMRAVGGLAKEARFFELLPSHFQEGADYDIYVARAGDRVDAALLIFWRNVTAEYFTPAIAHEARSGQPMAAILAEAMADAVARGIRRWNWGGTWLSQTGVYRFKRKWGAAERRYTYYTQLNDRDLLRCAPEELRSRFPNFFVVPFNALDTPGAS